VSKAITKANRALNANKLISKYFKKDELLSLLTSNFYLILYYNSEVWHLGSLKRPLKQQLLSTSAKALRVALKYPDINISYVQLHTMAGRATPKMFCNYKLALLLYKTINEEVTEEDWLSLNFNQIFTSRQSRFRINKTKPISRIEWSNATGVVQQE
jgi:hypothetical protein